MKKIKLLLFQKLWRKIRPVLAWLALFLILFVFLRASVKLAFYRYDHFGSGKFDTGNMAQAVWNTAHGRFLEVTDHFGTNATRFGNSHVDVVLALFAPIFLILPDPKVLIFSQVVLLILGAVPVFLIAVRKLRSHFAALFLALAYLLYPAVGHLVIADFHGIILSATFFLFAFYFLIREYPDAPSSGIKRRRKDDRTPMYVGGGRHFLLLDRRKPFWIFIILALMGREDISMIVALLGLYVWLVMKKAVLGKKLFLVGSAWFLLSFFVITPHFGAIRVQSYNDFASFIGNENIPPRPGNEQNFFLANISDLGESYGEIAKNIFLKPSLLWGKVFKTDNFDYLVKILSPLGFISLLSPSILALSLPTFLINFLGAPSRYRFIEYHYVSMLIPPVFIATIFSISWLADKLAIQRKISIRRSASVFILSLLTLLQAFNSVSRSSSPVWGHLKSVGEIRFGRFLPLVELSVGDVFGPRSEPSPAVEQEPGTDSEIESKLEAESKEPGVTILSPAVEQEPGTDSEIESKLEAESKEPGVTVSLGDPRFNGSAKDVLNLIPLGASVSVPDYLGSFTSLREYNSLFPANFRSADFVVVDLLTPQFISSMDNLDIGVLVPRFLKELLEDENYTLVYSSGGLVAFARGSDEPRRTFSIEETTLTAIPRIVFKKGVNLEGFEIPEKMTAEEKVKISFDWSVSSDLKKKVFFVSTWKNNGRIYQEIHLPSFALLPVDQWEEGKVYHEEFGVVLPDKLPAGNYEFVLSVIDFDYRENVESHYLQMVEIK